jgi:hypothetical protein
LVLDNADAVIDALPVDQHSIAGLRSPCASLPIQEKGLKWIRLVKGNRMLKCPCCKRQIKVIWGTFPCPWCGEKLHWDLGLTLLECSILGVLIFVVPSVIAFWLWPVDYAPWLAPLLVLLLDFPISFVFIFVRLRFFPSEVKRDSGWPDDGMILHITNPPEPPKESRE